MRSTADRIRHALAFEITGLLAILPLGALLFGRGLAELGPLAVASSLIATVWVFIYNLLFDRMLLLARGHLRKGIALRLVQALFFEVGMLLILLPIIAWYLGVSLLEAFWLDVFLAVFYVIHAFVFNAIYDTLFPVTATERVSATDNDGRGLRFDQRWIRHHK